MSGLTERSSATPALTTQPIWAVAMAIVTLTSPDGKRCTKCSLVLALSNFSPLANGRPRAQCKACCSYEAKLWRQANPGRVREQKREAYRRNPAAHIESVRVWREKNPDKLLAQSKRAYENRDVDGERARLRGWKRANTEKVRASGQRYRKSNPDKIREVTRRFQALRLRAVPSWVNLELVQKFYDEAARLTAITGIPHEVDHIVPLISDVVCGLHWEGNLQVLTRAANRSKGNRFVP